MKSEKGWFVKSIISIIFVLTLLIFLPGIQGIKQEAVSYSGVIQSIDKDSKSILVNDAKVLISESTKIVGEKGKILQMNDLKPGLSVTIEGVRSSNGFLASRILIMSPKKKP